MTERAKIAGGLVNMRLKFPWSVIILQESLGLDLWLCIASLHIPHWQRRFCWSQGKNITDEHYFPWKEKLKNGLQILHSGSQQIAFFLSSCLAGDGWETQENTLAVQGQLFYAFGMEKRSSASSLNNI